MPRWSSILYGSFNVPVAAVVVVEDFLVDAADRGGFFDDQMRLRIEEYFALQARGRGDFDLQRVFAADLRVADEGERRAYFSWR